MTLDAQPGGVVGQPVDERRQRGLAGSTCGRQLRRLTIVGGRTETSAEPSPRRAAAPAARLAPSSHSFPGSRRAVRPDRRPARAPDSRWRNSPATAAEVGDRRRARRWHPLTKTGCGLRRRADPTNADQQPITAELVTAELRPAASRPAISRRTVAADATTAVQDASSQRPADEAGRTGEQHDALGMVFTTSAFGLRSLRPPRFRTQVASARLIRTRL